MADWKESVDRAGPRYVRHLGPAGQRQPPAGHGDTIAILIDALDTAMDPALEEALNQARASQSAVCLLFVIPKRDGQRPSHILALGREIGDQLTARVLRLCRGGLPPAVTIIVYWGASADVLTFIASSIQPAMVTMVQRDVQKAALLAADILRLRGCPVLLIPDKTTPSEGSLELPAPKLNALPN
jgi:hypothetical protein